MEKLQGMRPRWYGHVSQAGVDWLADIDLVWYFKRRFEGLLTLAGPSLALASVWLGNPFFENLKEIFVALPCSDHSMHGLKSLWCRLEWGDNNFGYLPFELVTPIRSRILGLGPMFWFNILSDRFSQKST